MVQLIAKRSCSVGFLVCREENDTTLRIAFALGGNMGAIGLFTHLEVHD